MIRPEPKPAAVPTRAETPSPRPPASAGSRWATRWATGWATGWATRWAKFALWLGLAIAGQAAALQLIEAGPFVRYQHYRPLEVLAETPVALAIVALQVVAVGVGLRGRLSTVFSWVNRHLGWWRVLAVVVFLVPLGAAASRDVTRFAVELVFAAIIGGINLANVILAVTSLPSAALAGLNAKLLGKQSGESRPNSKWDCAWAGAVLVTVAAGCLNWFCYERHPHVPDEVVYLLHARYFAAGELAMPLPSVPEAFDLDLMMYEADRWYCPVSPGWPAALAVGVWLGAAWLVNPVLAGVCVLLTYRLVRQAYDQGTARLVVLLFCLSPWQLFLAMSYMTHTFALACGLLAAVALLKARDTDRSVWALAAGAAVGMLALIRPLEGLISAAVLGLWTLGIGAKRFRFALVATFVAGALLVGSITLVYNHALTGNPLKFPLTAYTDKYYAEGVNSLGFGPNIGLGWGLDPFPGHG